MLATLEENEVGPQSVTFPVRAMFVGESQAGFPGRRGSLNFSPKKNGPKLE